MRQQGLTRPRQSRPQVLDIPQPLDHLGLDPTVPDPGGVGQVGGEVDPTVEDGVHLRVDPSEMSPTSAPVVAVVSVPRPPARPHLHISWAVNMQTWPSLGTPGLHLALVNGEIVDLAKV